MVATLEDVQVTSPRAGVSVVSLTGEHDVATRALMSELLESLVLMNDLVVADVTEAQFIDSSMLSVFIGADKLAREQGKDFRIQLGTEAIVKRVFQVTGILEHLRWAPSRDEALNGSQGASKHELTGASDGSAA
jgi:anti-anti-sigma factor